MNAQKQEQTQTKRKDARPRTAYVVGMDAHSKRLAIAVYEWSDPWNPVRHGNPKAFDFADLEKVYREQVPLDSITVIEASTNSAAIKRRLDEIGFRAEVVKSDTISGKESKRKVCDVQDAQNLAYLKGDVEDFVWVPSEKYSEYRSLLFAYRDAKKETQRNSNRLWNLCSMVGCALPTKEGLARVQEIKEAIKGRELDRIVQKRFEMMLADYEHYFERAEELLRLIAETVVHDEAFIDLMQLPGFFYETSFAFGTVIEDARRFSKASKVAAYCTLAPQKDTSGEEEVRAKKKGGAFKPTDPEGRRDLKFYLCEAAQTVLNTCPKCKLGKWGHHLTFKGKLREKVVVAVARKEATYAWHIMRGDLTPNRDGEALFYRKMIRFASVLGEKKMRELGYKSRAAFAEYHCNRLYGHLPKPEEMQDAEREKEND